MASLDPGAYRSLPSKMKETSCKELGMEELAEDPQHFVQSFLEARVKRKELEGGLMTQLRVQTLLLDPPYKPPKIVDTHRPPRRLTAKQKRTMKLYEIPKDQQKYEMFVALHELWKKYMEDLLQIDQGRSMSQSQLNQKVLKADYHGCLLTVARSKCPSYVGTKGIVLQETQNTMKVICKDNKVKTIPKAHSVFTFELGRFLYSLYGNHMRFRASERSARKFKDKATIDL